MKEKSTIILFLNINDRFIYIKQVLQEVVNQCKEGREIFFLYDVNCTFGRWLQVNFPDLHHRIKRFAIPVLHAYGHKLECQINFNPRRMEGFGLTDGEGCERLWSLLSPSVPIVRQMRLCVFKDFLSLLIMHISEKKTQKLASSLWKKFNDLSLTRDKCKEELIKIKSNDANISSRSPSFFQEDEFSDQMRDAMKIFIIASNYLSERNILFRWHHGTKASSRIGRKKTIIGKKLTYFN